MNSFKTALVAAGLIVSLGAAGTAVADEDDDAYEVTVINLTRGQVFTPLLVASHDRSVRLFSAGEAASPQLAELAESGSTSSLRALLETLPGVLDVTTAGDADVILPGDRLTLTVATQGRFNRVSLAAMLVPTNDAFVALNSVRGPRGNKSKAYHAIAYDAGSENNDEVCVSIPGPPFVCVDGEGVSPPADSDEGYVHIHAGIHGIGDLSAAERDWRNPVARVIITKVSDD